MDGQVVVKTCEDGTLKYNQYHNISEDVQKSHGARADKKTRRNDCERSRKRDDEKRRTGDYE